MGKILFILAGYSGVGKSTLLVNALRNNLPIFGSEYNGIFQSTKTSPRFPEWTLSSQEILNHGSWFRENDISFLAKDSPLPHHIVLHVDLIELLHNQYSLQNCPDELISLLPRTFNSFANDAHNELFFRYILSNDFYKKFDHIIVNTLIASWETNTKQWQTRQSTQLVREKGLRPLLFNFRHPRPDIHQSILKSWLNSIKILKPYLSFISESKDGHFFMKKQG